MNQHKYNLLVLGAVAFAAALWFSSCGQQTTATYFQGQPINCSVTAVLPGTDSNLPQGGAMMVCGTQVIYIATGTHP